MFTCPGIVIKPGNIQVEAIPSNHFRYADVDYMFNLKLDKELSNIHKILVDFNPTKENDPDL